MALIHAIDFDGVIADKNLLPMEGAQEAIKTLWQRGDTIIVHTVKARTESGRCMVIDWLRLHQIHFHEVTAIKPQADCYLDDKAERFTDWKSYPPLTGTS
jgi:hypothetical protein